MKSLGLCAALCLQLVHIRAQEPEPEWNGKRLSTWIRETTPVPRAGKAYDVLFIDETPTKIQVEAAKAIRQRH